MRNVEAREIILEAAHGKPWQREFDKTAQILQPWRQFIIEKQKLLREGTGVANVMIFSSNKFLYVIADPDLPEHEIEIEISEDHDAHIYDRATR